MCEFLEIAHKNFKMSPEKKTEYEIIPYKFNITMSLNLKDVSTGVTYYLNRYIRHFNHNPRGFYIRR